MMHFKFNVHQLTQKQVLQKTSHKKEFCEINQFYHQIHILILIRKKRLYVLVIKKKFILFLKEKRKSQNNNNKIKL